MAPRTYARLTRLALWALATIVITGAAVRLTNSGLGCSDWPTCEDDRFVAELDDYHSMIEFVNRMFTGVVSAAVIVAVVGSLRRRPRRADLTRWSLGLVAGVVAQVVLGGLLVRTELDPRFTMGHFLLSMVLLWNAVVLDDRARHDPPGAPRDSSRSKVLADLVTVATAALLVTGTVVTGSGPHSGDDHASRLGFDIREVARIHSLTAISVLGLVAVTWWALRNERRVDAAPTAVRVLALLVVQGIVGYTQYFTGVPVLLVGIHVLLATLTWIETVRLRLAVLRAPQPDSGACDAPRKPALTP